MFESFQSSLQSSRKLKLPKYQSFKAGENFGAFICLPMANMHLTDQPPINNYRVFFEVSKSEP